MSQGDNATITINIVREKGTYGEVTFFIFSQNEDAVVDKDYDCEPIVSIDKLFLNIYIHLEFFILNPEIRIGMNFSRIACHI